MMFPADLFSVRAYAISPCKVRRVGRIGLDDKLYVRGRSNAPHNRRSVNYRPVQRDSCGTRIVTPPHQCIRTVRCVRPYETDSIVDALTIEKPGTLRPDTNGKRQGLASRLSIKNDAVPRIGIVCPDENAVEGFSR